MRAYASVIIASLIFTPAAALASQSTQIGHAERIKEDVTGTLESDERKLKKGDKIHQNEVIATAEKSEAELVLEDETKLAVGPKSQISLDSFIYDPDKKDGEVVINAAKGAFRFVTGKSAKSAYTIKTPASTIGVRGTTFDGFVDDNGEIALLLLDGEIDVCNSARSCKRLNRRGYFLHIRRNGVISDPRKWDGTFFNHIDLGHAFPFIGRQLRISPKVRYRHADLLGGRLLRKGRVPSGRSLGRKLKRTVPRPRIRRPF
ncbi:MAG: FecR domain-containing protein [Hyphomicrobiaceae bacterium]|nr:FecR domain-containing protein [Hyphomicrobiaceae bacterium]